MTSASFRDLDAAPAGPCPFLTTLHSLFTDMRPAPTRRLSYLFLPLLLAGAAALIYEIVRSLPFTKQQGEAS